MVQTVRRRLFTVDACVQSQVRSRQVFGRESGTVSGFSPSNSVFPYQYHSTIAHATLTNGNIIERYFLFVVI